MLRRLVLIFTLLASTALDERVRAGERLVLRVGMDTRAAPWCFVPGLDYSKEDQTKPPLITRGQIRKLAGLDVDVVHALARRVSAQVEVVPMPWAGLESGLLDRRYDLLVSGWTPRLNTPDAIVASAPYLEWGLQIAVRAGSPIRSYADLEDRRVGHYDDPVVVRALEALGKGRFKTYGSVSAMFGDLKSGALDAVIFDSVHVRWRIAHDPSLRAVGEPLNRLGYHVGLRRDDAALLARVQAAIKDLVASGEMERIRWRWEGPGTP